jgi:hypothetical protein
LTWLLARLRRLEKMTIEIVGLPIENGWIFHSYGTVYQRVAIRADNHTINLWSNSMLSTLIDSISECMIEVGVSMKPIMREWNHTPQSRIRIVW